MNKRISRKILCIALSFVMITTFMPLQNVYAAKKIKTKAVVSTQRSLKKVLKNKKLKTLVIKTNKKSKFSIPKGSHKKLNIVVNAPKSDVVNKSRFKSIKIKGIAKNTWKEYAKGNSFVVDAPQAHIDLKKSASVKEIEIVKANCNVIVDTRNNLSKISIASKVSLEIKGSTDKGVLIDVMKGADGSAVKSNVKIALNTESSVQVSLDGGAEGSEINTKISNIIVELTNNTSDSSIKVKENINDADKEEEAPQHAQSQESQEIEPQGPTEKELVSSANAFYQAKIKDVDLTKCSTETNQILSECSSNIQSLSASADAGEVSDAFLEKYNNIITKLQSRKRFQYVGEKPMLYGNGESIEIKSDVPECSSNDVLDLKKIGGRIYHIVSGDAGSYRFYRENHTEIENWNGASSGATLNKLKDAYYYTVEDHKLIFTGWNTGKGGNGRIIQDLGGSNATKIARGFDGWLPSDYIGQDHFVIDEDTVLYPQYTDKFFVAPVSSDGSLITYDKFNNIEYEVGVQDECVQIEVPGVIGASADAYCIWGRPFDSNLTYAEAGAVTVDGMGKGKINTQNIIDLVNASENASNKLLSNCIDSYPIKGAYSEDTRSIVERAIERIKASADSDIDVETSTPAIFDKRDLANKKLRAIKDLLDIAGNNPSIEVQKLLKASTDIIKVQDKESDVDAKREDGIASINAKQSKDDVDAFKVNAKETAKISISSEATEASNRLKDVALSGDAQTGIALAIKQIKASADSNIDTATTLLGIYDERDLANKKLRAIKDLLDIAGDTLSAAVQEALKTAIDNVKSQDIDEESDVNTKRQEGIASINAKQNIDTVNEIKLNVKESAKNSVNAEATIAGNKLSGMTLSTEGKLYKTREIETMWGWLVNTVRANQLNGCDDWYVPSVQEQLPLTKNTELNKPYSERNILSSVERTYGYAGAWRWRVNMKFFQSRPYYAGASDSTYFDAVVVRSF